MTDSWTNNIHSTLCEQTIYTVYYVTNVKCALKNLKLLKTELRNRSVTLCLMKNSHLSWSKDQMKPFGWQNSFREQFSAKLGGHNVGSRYHKWTQTHEIILDVMSRTLADYVPDCWSTHSFIAGTGFWIQFQLSVSLWLVNYQNWLACPTCNHQSVVNAINQHFITIIVNWLTFPARKETIIIQVNIQNYITTRSTPLQISKKTLVLQIKSCVLLSSTYLLTVAMYNDWKCQILEIFQHPNNSNTDLEVHTSLSCNTFILSFPSLSTKTLSKLSTFS